MKIYIFPFLFLNLNSYSIIYYFVIILYSSATEVVSSLCPQTGVVHAFYCDGKSTYHIHLLLPSPLFYFLFKVFIIIEYSLLQ
jgi:hypothetical protein